MLGVDEFGQDTSLQVLVLEKTQVSQERSGSGGVERSGQVKSGQVR